MDGMETLTQILQKYPGLLVIMLTAHGTIQRAVEATKLGAFDFLEKPFQSEHIKQKVDQALERHRITAHSTRDELIHSYEEIIGESPQIVEVLKVIEKVADTNSTVLIQGETGTGKELVARAVHQNSGRASKNMVVEVTIAIPQPDKVDEQVVLGVLPHGKGVLKVVQGGLEIEGREGSGDKTIVANAAVIAKVDVP